MSRSSGGVLWFIVGLFIFIAIAFVVSTRHSQRVEVSSKDAQHGGDFNGGAMNHETANSRNINSETANSGDMDRKSANSNNMDRESANSKERQHPPLTDPLEYPFFNQTTTVVIHPGFALLYNEQHEQASWVAYELTRDELAGTVSRTDKFLPDPKIETGSAINDDYRNSGYDRGHLAPAADLKWSHASMNASFFYSNMSPQLPGFNRGIWKQAEELVRKWANHYGAVYVVTGPVLSNGLPTIGPNNVSIPEYYYKLVIDTALMRSAALLIPHQSSKRPLATFLVSIDSVERLTGLDFFHQLNDTFEASLEKAITPEKWIWE